MPSELTNKLVEDRIEQPDAADGFILDGYPRSVAQAQALDEMLKNHDTKLDAVLEFAVSEEELFKRLKARGRADDTEEVIHNRMKVYARRDRGRCWSTTATTTCRPSTRSAGSTRSSPARSAHSASNR